MTYLGRLFNRSAHSPGRDAQRVPNHSSLRRPSSRAEVPSASAYSILAHSSRSFPPAWPNQPPRLYPSSPSGSWTTPSSDTFVLTTIFPIFRSPSLPTPGSSEPSTINTLRRRETGRQRAAHFAPRAVYIHQCNRGGRPRRPARQAASRARGRQRWLYVLTLTGDLL